MDMPPSIPFIKLDILKLKTNLLTYVKSPGEITPYPNQPKPHKGYVNLGL